MAVNEFFTTINGSSSGPQNARWEWPTEIVEQVNNATLRLDEGDTLTISLNPDGAGNLITNSFKLVRISDEMP